MPRDKSFVNHLAEVSLFSALSKKELGLVARRAEDVSVAAGKVLISEGTTGHEFFVVLAGTAKVTRRGRRVATLGPGDAFGELALLDRSPRNATVTAETPMELVVLGQREFAGLIDDVPGFSRKLLAGMPGGCAKPTPLRPSTARGAPDRAARRPHPQLLDRTLEREVGGRSLISSGSPSSDRPPTSCPPVTTTRPTGFPPARRAGTPARRRRRGQPEVAPSRTATAAIVRAASSETTGPASTPSSRT